MAKAPGGDSSMIIIVIIIAVGAFLLMKKKGDGAPVTSVPVTLQPPYPAPSYATTTSTSEGFTPTLDPIQVQTGPVKTGPILPTSQYGMQLTSAYGSDKTGMPITSPSLYYSDPTRFDALSAGNCQCDDNQCCYWAPFQSRFGPMQTNYNVTRKCVAISYGDTPQACNRAFALFQDSTAAYNDFSNRAYPAFMNAAPDGRGISLTKYHALRRWNKARMGRILSTYR